MPDIDKDKIRDMEYDPSRGRYVGKDGSELRVTPYSDGTGYKYDYYPSSTYDNVPHNSSHIKADLNENWTKTDNDRENGTQEQSSGTGCYLTSACMRHFADTFDDNCRELKVLRWFRDRFVTDTDKAHYYVVAPVIVEAIDAIPNGGGIYDYIYNHIIAPCVEAIEAGNYEFAYDRYKSSTLVLEETFAKPALQKRLVRTLKTQTI